MDGRADRRAGYEAHDARHGNRAEAEEICALVSQYGLAVFLRRCGTPLSPVEILAAPYAATHAHPARRHRLAPMEADVLVRAVRADPRASGELVSAALALLPGVSGRPGLPGASEEGDEAEDRADDGDGDELRARPGRTAPGA
ncbi:hypothetical protein [Streptomyces sp. OR43]|uniref:hypothetical protein n=1 Tax=Streptomyces sp. or43 TaxID=2478957 RepID=UPI0011CE9EAA|nr:hypothetical protein [Streptomyces sp. or43]